MNENRWAQAGALLLAVSMFVVVIAKAQGCKPRKSDNAALPATKVGPIDVLPAAGDVGARGLDAGETTPRSGTDAGRVADAGKKDAGGEAAVEDEPNIRALPATKSGMIRVLPSDEGSSAGGPRNPAAKPTQQAPAGE